MRDQTIFFEKQVGDKRIVVIKTYDTQAAQAAFGEMSLEALEALRASLDLDSKFDAADITSPNDEDFADFLWEAVEDGAREDWNLFSYFIVREEHAGQATSLFVSSDWPSAEAFAKNTSAVAA